MQKSIENDGRHIRQVVEISPCSRHKRDKGTPCWDIYYDTHEGRGPAVCGSRIRAAGFVGTISASSIQLKNAGGRTNARR